MKKLALGIVLLVAIAGVTLLDPPFQPPRERVEVGAPGLSGEVVSVADGDTLTIRVGDERVRVRLQGIDCPEREQDFGKEAANFLEEKVEGKRISIRELGKDQYDRVLGEAFLDGENLNKALLANGLAWWYERHARDRTDYRDAQEDAKKAGRGLWSDPEAVPPWEFRRRSN